MAEKSIEHFNYVFNNIFVRQDSFLKAIETRFLSQLEIKTYLCLAVVSLNPKIHDFFSFISKKEEISH